MDGRLVHAREQERLRIARELHDGFAQRLAILSLDLGTLADTGNSVDIRERLAQLSLQVAVLGSDLHRVTHELHPVTLDRFGLEAAIRAFCNELSTSCQISIHLDAHDLPRPLSHDVELCLYRIAQEALNNVVRHSGASTATLSVGVRGADIVLAVVDNGAGFDADALRIRTSLGLTSMRERVKLLGGRFVLHTNKSWGTRVEVRIPDRH